MVNPLAESGKSAVEAVASHPTVASAASITLTTMGTASFLNGIQTALGMVSLVIGIGIGLLVLRINRIKLQLYKRMLDNGESLKE